MKQLTSIQLREIRKEFRISKQHRELSEVSLIADKSSTALFNVAGMQPLIPYLMGKDHPLGKRLFNIQKCIRTVDIDEVGDSSHLTFFEMMGNRSLGDYFKKEAVSWSREFLTKYLEMDPRKLAVTVFEGDDAAPKDEETARYRKEVGLPTEKISYLPAKHNRWSPGPVGPCGPDTEIFYRVGESEFPPEGSNVKSDEDNWLEIWNNVFMEYYRDES
jgi:alanyl-tRNA synthetase